MNGSIINGMRIGKILIFSSSLLIAAAADAFGAVSGPSAADESGRNETVLSYTPWGTFGQYATYASFRTFENKYKNTDNNVGVHLASVFGRNDICPTGPQDALPDREPGRHETAIAITQDILLAGPPYTAYSPLGGFPGNPSSLPRYAVKSNLLYAAGTLTPNLAVEFALSGKASLVISGSYNPWNLNGSDEDNTKLVHWTIHPELRYWLCERFNGHFFGVNPFYTEFNVGGRKIPFVNFKKENRYEGWALGAGVNYGYHLPIEKRWGLEFAVGVGAAYMNYGVFDCMYCGDRLESKTKWYFGPTHAAINLVFLIK